MPKPTPASTSAGVGRPRAVSARVVAKIVKLRDGGASYPSIAGQLNDQGVPLPAGGAAWTPAGVRQIYLAEQRRQQGLR